MIQKGQQNKEARGKETLADKTLETSTIMPKLGVFLEEKKSKYQTRELVNELPDLKERKKIS